MNTITKESIADTIEGLEQLVNRGIQSVHIDMAIAGMRRLLASLEAEAVYFVEIEDGQDINAGRIEGKNRPDLSLLPDGINHLYAAPPAPVSVPDAYVRDGRGRMMLNGMQEPRIGYSTGWNACRAAMLQGADRPQNEPQNIPENIPATQFKPVADLYGLTSPTGGETSFTFDAVEARDFIDGGWSCQEYVELGRFQESMLQNGNSPAQSDCCPEQNYIAPAQDGNSPVIPDGWVMVPIEPTMEILDEFDSIIDYGAEDSKEAWSRLLAAAPQQEVK
ncbi:hypothetical protein L420_03756 [Enterobacter hormaechei subsp. hoffmannii UCICRE 9]|uniref:hypothetical protein n=1 Tax=Enterobacter hormaechei TaxID=158836 RepID=UPI0003BE5A49|nr:hypothetical protein [Enterobacter hormaechei]ESL86561.1 hypothetical protein L420_03756 [Enterobacter hormaechei subsp. hoffmannii UCICRE 9]